MSDNQAGKKKTDGVRTLFWIMGTYLVYSFVGIFSKLASGSQILSVRFIVMAGAVFMLMAVYALIYQQLIKRVDLSTVYSLKGIVVIYNLFWAAVIFREAITVFNLAGAMLILAGVYLVGKDD